MGDISIFNVSIYYKRKKSRECFNKCFYALFLFLTFSICVKAQTQTRTANIYYNHACNTISIPVEVMDSVCVKAQAQTRVINIYNNHTSNAISIPIEVVDSICVRNVDTSAPESEKYNGLPIVKLYADEPVTKENKTYGSVKQIMKYDTGIVTEEFNYLTIKGRGNSTWVASDKKPYKVKFSKDFSMIGLPQERSWIFFSNPLDSSMLRNEIGFALSRMSNLAWTPNSGYADVYLNDDYRGTYQISDKVEISKTKVKVGEDGFLIEVVPWNRLNNEEVYFDTPNLIFSIEDFEEDTDSENYKFIKDYVTLCEEAIYSKADVASNGMRYDELIDVDSYVDWYLINEIMKNVDGIMFSSCKMHKARAGKLCMGPVWDFDLSLGNCLSWHKEDLKHPENLYIADAPWFKQLLKKSEFYYKVKQRYEFFYLNKENLLNIIENKAALIKASAECDALRWGKSDYDQQVKKVVTFLSDRMDWLHHYFQAK